MQVVDVLHPGRANVSKVFYFMIFIFLLFIFLLGIVKMIISYLKEVNVRYF